MFSLGGEYPVKVGFQEWLRQTIRGMKTFELLTLSSEKYNSYIDGNGELNKDLFILYGAGIFGLDTENIMIDILEPEQFSYNGKNGVGLDATGLQFNGKTVVFLTKER